MPKISIITTFFNAADTLNQTIDSVLQQDFEDYEYILIDDGSDDNSCSIISDYDDSRICLQKPGRMGRVEALNVGLNAARGDYIAILDADDCCFKQRLSHQYKQLINNPQITLVYSNAELIDISGNKIGVTTFPVTHENILASLISLNPFPHSSVMYRRQLAVEMGGYNWRCEKSIDYNFYLALILAGGKVQGYERPLIQLRSHADSWGKQDQQALQMRYGVMGLVNYYQKQHGQVGIMELNGGLWESAKESFNQWFDNMYFQNQIGAKQHLYRARQNLRNIELIALVKNVFATLKLDPWFWRYRGCNFSYPKDIEKFLVNLLNKE